MESIAVIEAGTIHEGIATIDAMAKSSRIEILAASPIPPGRFLIVVGGAVAEVEVAFHRGLEVSLAPIDRLFLAEAHPGLVEAIRALSGDANARAASSSRGRDDAAAEASIDSLGLYETRTVSAALEAGDRGLKGTSARLLHLHVARGIAGKAIGLFEGRQDAVEAALLLARERAELHDAWIGSTLLARPDPMVARRLLRAPWGFFEGQEVL